METENKKKLKFLLNSQFDTKTRVLYHHMPHLIMWEGGWQRARAKMKAFGNCDMWIIDSAART